MTATTIRGAGLGCLLGEMRGIAIGIVIEVEIRIEIGIEVAGIWDRHQWSDRCRGKVSSLESMQIHDASLHGLYQVRFDNARNSIGSYMNGDQSSLHSESTVSHGQVF